MCSCDLILATCYCLINEEIFTPLSDVSRKPGSDFDWLIAEWCIRLEGMSEI